VLIVPVVKVDLPPEDCTLVALIILILKPVLAYFEIFREDL